jgi:hypothetical protein
MTIQSKNPEMSTKCNDCGEWNKVEMIFDDINKRLIFVPIQLCKCFSGYPIIIREPEQKD